MNSSNTLKLLGKTWQAEHTGGGCMAWACYNDDNTYYLLTNQDFGLYEDGNEWIIGLYCDVTGAPIAMVEQGQLVKYAEPDSDFYSLSYEDAKKHYPNLEF